MDQKHVHGTFQPRFLWVGFFSPFNYAHKWVYVNKNMRRLPMLGAASQISVLAIAIRGDCTHIYQASEDWKTT